MTSYVLTKRVAPVQQGFYFVNDSMSADGRYLWFYSAFPPALHRTLGVVDLVDQEVRHFPETNASGAHVDPATGNVFWCEGQVYGNAVPTKRMNRCSSTNFPPNSLGRAMSPAWLAT
ncbi:MAG: hypothetical protein R2867_21280 [Caldilineaceae bacterium]